MMADPTGLWLWPIQCLHALTFGAGHLGAIAFISRAVPDRYSAAAQGAAGAMAGGAAMALQMALAAWLYPTLGGRTYALGAASAALGLALLPLARPPLARRRTRGLIPAKVGASGGSISDSKKTTVSDEPSHDSKCLELVLHHLGYKYSRRRLRPRHLP